MNKHHYRLQTDIITALLNTKDFVYKLIIKIYPTFLNEYINPIWNIISIYIYHNILFYWSFLCFLGFLFIYVSFPILWHRIHIPRLIFDATQMWKVWCMFPRPRVRNPSPLLETNSLFCFISSHPLAAWNERVDVATMDWSLYSICESSSLNLCHI